MAQYEDRDMSGSLFVNKEKTAANPNWADLQGNVMVDGKKYYLSGWKKVSSQGTKWISIALKPVVEKATAGGGGQQSSLMVDGEGPDPF